MSSLSKRLKKPLKRIDDYVDFLLRLPNIEEQRQYLSTEVPSLMRTRVKEIVELIQFSRAVKDRFGLRAKSNRLHASGRY